MIVDHLFVYGTLRRSADGLTHRLLGAAEFIGTGRYQGILYDLGNYPGAVASDDPDDIVYGEVYRLRDPASILAGLDEYEGCGETVSTPPEYERAVARILLASDAVIHAYLYLYRRPCGGLRRIVSGDYLA